MKPELLTFLLGAVVLIAEGLNVYLFLRIRVAQLEGEKRVLDEVERKYIRKPDPASALFAPRHRALG